MRGWLEVALLSGLLWACAQPSRSLLRAPEPPQVFTEECGGLRVQFTLERKPRGAPAYDVYVTALSGQLLTDTTRVLLAFTSAGKDISTTTLVAQPKEAGHYGPAGGFALTPGPWKVEVLVRRTGGPEATCAFDLNL